MPSFSPDNGVDVEAHGVHAGEDPLLAREYARLLRVIRSWPDLYMLVTASPLTFLPTLLFAPLPFYAFSLFVLLLMSRNMEDVWTSVCTAVSGYAWNVLAYMVVGSTLVCVYNDFRDLHCKGVLLYSMTLDPGVTFADRCAYAKSLFVTLVYKWVCAVPSKLILLGIYVQFHTCMTDQPTPCLSYPACINGGLSDFIRLVIVVAFELMLLVFSLKWLFHLLPEEFFLHTLQSVVRFLYAIEHNPHAD